MDAAPFPLMRLPTELRAHVIHRLVSSAVAEGRTGSLNALLLANRELADLAHRSIRRVTVETEDLRDVIVDVDTEFPPHLVRAEIIVKKKEEEDEDETDDESETEEMDAEALEKLYEELNLDNESEKDEEEEGDDMWSEEYHRAWPDVASGEIFMVNQNRLEVFVFPSSAPVKFSSFARVAMKLRWSPDTDEIDVDSRVGEEGIEFSIFKALEGRPGDRISYMRPAEGLMRELGRVGTLRELKIDALFAPFRRHISSVAQIVHLDLSVSRDSRTLQRSDLKAISERLENMESLDLSGNNLESIAPLESCARLTKISMRFCRGFWSLNPLSRCHSLRHLDLRHCKRILKIDALADAAELVFLDITGCTKIRSSKEALDLIAERIRCRPGGRFVSSVET